MAKHNGISVGPHEHGLKWTRTADQSEHCRIQCVASSEADDKQAWCVFRVIAGKRSLAIAVTPTKILIDNREIPCRNTPTRPALRKAFKDGELSGILAISDDAVAVAQRKSLMDKYGIRSRSRKGE